MVVGSIFFPDTPYHREGDTFVGEVGRPARAAQYHLSQYLESTLLVSWRCGAMGILCKIAGEGSSDVASRRNDPYHGEPGK
jgi:hypothetical protein